MGKKWKTIEPGVWKPDQRGDSIEGVLVNVIPKDENGGMSARYYLETKDGMLFVWGSTVLDDRMQYVQVGQEIRITYDGQDTNKKGQRVNLYKVDVAETDDEKLASAGPEQSDVDFEVVR